MDSLRIFLVEGDCGRFDTELLPQKCSESLPVTLHLQHGCNCLVQTAVAKNSVLPFPGREYEEVWIALTLCRALSAAACDAST